MQRVVFIETSDIGARYSAEAARRLGFEPFFICDFKDYHADPRKQLEGFQHLDCPTSSAAALVQSLLQTDVAAVTSFADSRLRVACELSKLLGVRGLDPAVPLLKDKGQVAQLIPEFSPPTCAFDLAHGLPVEWIHCTLQSYPALIIKPSAGAGAKGVHFVQRDSDLGQLTLALRSDAVPSSMLSGGWLAQACLPGKLASLEGYALQGQTRHLGFTSRKKVGFTESAASFPADATLSPKQRASAKLAAETLIQRSGFKNGYFHIEFIFDDEGDQGECRLIDANMGRLGGGPVGELLALSYGIDPVCIYQHVLEVSLLGQESRDIYPGGSDSCKLRESHAILYGLKTGGELGGVEIPQDSHCFHTQLLGPGAHVSPMGTDDWSWVGVLTGLRQDTLRTASQLKIHTAEGVFHAYY